MSDGKQDKEIKEKADRAEFLDAAYRGGEGYKDTSALVRYKNEDETDYSKRLSSSSYTNYCSPVIDSYIAFLYRDGVDRQDTGLSDEVLSDIDANNSDIDAFSREVMTISSIESAVGVLVDKPESTLDSRQDELDLGIHPYATIFPLSSILEYDEEVVFGHRMITKLVLLESSGEDFIEYKEWGTDEWVLWKKDKNAKPEMIDSGVNPLGEIPFISVVNKGKSLLNGVSDIDDIADINRRIFNIDSNSMTLSEKTAFPMLQGPRDVIDSDSSDEGLEVGPENVLAFDEENPSAKYEWLEPDNTSISRNLELKDDARRDINNISKLNIAEVEQTSGPESGVALELRFQQLNALLSSKAETAEDFEERLLYLMNKWNGDEYNGSVTFPRKFGIRDLSADLDTAMKSLTVINSKRYKDLLAESFVGRMLKDADPNDIKEIINELKESKSIDILDALNGGGVPNV